MRLLGVLLVFVCIQRTSAQTCAVGQVLVNSACTYNDPELMLWYKLDLANPTLNSGNLVTGTGYDLTTASSGNNLCCTANAFAKKGTGSLDATYAVQSNAKPLSTFGTYTSFTLSFWMYFTDCPITGADFLVFGTQYYALADEYGVALKLYGGNLICIVPTAGEFKVVDSLFTSPYFSTWLHVVVTYEPNFYRFYLNGNLVTIPGILTGDATKWPYYTSWRLGYVPTVPLTNYLLLSVASYNWTSFKTDDVRIYRRALSATEVSWLYAPCGSGDSRYYEETYTCASSGCNAGYTGPDGGTCVGCGVGKYKTTTGSAACTDCAAGTYSTTVAAYLASTCITCPADRRRLLVRRLVTNQAVR